MKLLAVHISTTADTVGAGRNARLVRLVWFAVSAVLLALTLACLWRAGPVLAAGGVPQAVWQDTDRNHRRSPAQVKTQLRPPQVRAGQMPLSPEAQDARAAKTSSSWPPMLCPWPRKGS